MWASAQAYVQTQELPTHNYGKQEPRIENEELSSEIQVYLQGVSKYACAQDVVKFTKDNGVQKQYGLTKLISLATAKCWMGQMEFRWTKEPKGQYQNSHECEDVVEYCQKSFLPTWTEFEEWMHDWTDDNIHLKIDELPNSMPDIKNVVAWFHDKSTFYAHDRCDQCWVL